MSSMVYVHNSTPATSITICNTLHCPSQELWASRAITSGHSLPTFFWICLFRIVHASEITQYFTSVLFPLFPGSLLLTVCVGMLLALHVVALPPTPDTILPCW